MMNVGSIVFEPAPLREPVRPVSETQSAFEVIRDTFFKPVDHSIFFTAPPLAPAQTESPMQLYCYVKQLDEVRTFMRRLDISKHVYPLRDAAELERLCLHGQVFVHFPDHVETCDALAGRALIEGMFVMEIHVGERN